ncbi:MAG TPA: response regulator [Bryobacteraceae bacterium]|nr:response regulator [Bryobacteraceae bacterium]
MPERKVPVPYTPSILVVDDNNETRQMFRRELEETGYYVSEARTGREARHASRDRFFDVMILDMSMPDEDGIELLQYMRSELPSVKVLAVSGFMQGAFLSVARNLGASSSLQKPVSPETLMREIYKLLATHF